MIDTMTLMRPVAGSRLLVAMLLAVGIGCWSMPRSDAVLCTRSADYIEDGFPQQDGHHRVLAEVQATIRSRGTGQALSLQLSAIGPRVEPILGYRGIHGANYITAREFRAIHQERRIAVVTSTRGDNRRRRGAVRPGRIGHVAERRFAADRGVVLDARSAEAYPLELWIDSGQLPAGSHQTEVMVDGSSRLRVSFYTGAAPRITAIECLGGLTAGLQQ
jgi:hypothetical protein